MESIISARTSICQSAKTAIAINLWILSCYGKPWCLLLVADNIALQLYVKKLCSKGNLIELGLLVPSVGYVV